MAEGNGRWVKTPDKVGTTASPPRRWSCLGIGSLIFLGIGLVFIGTWRLRNAFDDLGMGAARSGVFDMLKQQQDAWNRGDIPSFVSFYQMSPDITFYSDDVVDSGWVGVSDRFTNSYVIKKKPMGRLEFSETVFVPMSSEAVLVRGRWTTVHEGTTRTGLFTILVKQIGGYWKIVHDHTSESKPKP